jgi:serine/threonine protein kinase
MRETVVNSVSRIAIDSIFQVACDLPADRQSAYLDEACAGNESLRREVEELLRIYEANKTFLENPAIQDVAKELAASDSGSLSSQSLPMIGRQIGNYRIQAMLGRGGMGEVYLAHDNDLDVDVAIKFLSEAYASDPQWQSRFNREGRLNTGPTHQNLAGLRHKGEVDGRPFWVFEYVPGETLKDKLDRGPLPIKEALPLFSQLAETLSQAHDKGIIRRDLKPSNLMVTPMGRLKVLDFGIAKKITADLATIELGVEGDNELTCDYGKTRKGQVMGTVAYMSPEQTRGEPLGAHTDVWAFGCVLYETLTGKRPFGGISTYDILHSIRNDEPDWEALPLQTPKPLRQMLRKALHKDPHQRLRSAAEAQQIIDRLLTHDHFWPKLSSWLRQIANRFFSTNHSLSERYAYLVDKKYDRGLSKIEEDELLRQKQQLEDENAVFYEPIIQRLTILEKRLGANSQQGSEKE